MTQVNKINKKILRNVLIGSVTLIVLMTYFLDGPFISIRNTLASLLSVYRFEEIRRISRQVDQSLEDSKFLDSVLLPELPYPPLSEIQLKTREECVANSQKFAGINKIDSHSDIIGMCTCFQVATAALNPENETGPESEIKFMRILEALSNKCKIRHKILPTTKK